MSYPFIEAKNYLDIAPGRRIDVIPLHTMEAPEANDTAENVARWFAGPTAPMASAHYCVDNNSIVQGVRDHDVAYAAPGANHNGLQIEMAGYAGQAPAQWDDAYSTALLANVARLVREKCAEHDIPVTWLSIDEVRAGKRGITSHNNVSKAFGKSTHWDPGPNFPAAEFLALVRNEEIDLPLTNDEITNIAAAVWRHVISEGDGYPGPLVAARHVRSQSAKLDKLIARPTASVDVDSEAIAAAIAAALGPELAAKVAAELSRRLAS